MIRPADVAWMTLAAAVLAYDTAAALRKDCELLSEAADRYRKAKPILTHCTVLYVAGHLLRRWPQRLDPLHQLAVRLAR